MNKQELIEQGKITQQRILSYLAEFNKKIKIIYHAFFYEHGTCYGGNNLTQSDA